MQVLIRRVSDGLLYFRGREFLQIGNARLESLDAGLLGRRGVALRVDIRAGAIIDRISTAAVVVGRAAPLRVRVSRRLVRRFHNGSDDGLPFKL